MAACAVEASKPMYQMAMVSSTVGSGSLLTLTEETAVIHLLFPFPS